jgi:1-pyrroline-5-carboxylate dehydrogenase
LYGDVSAKAAALLHREEVADFFVRCIQRVMPKSRDQAMGEVALVRDFLHNFSGDRVRFLAHSFRYPGDHLGQNTTGYRWPYGPVAIISPFNFPLEIPALQLMGALYMGNQVTIKNASTTSMVLEQFLRMMHFCGMPKTDVDLLHCSGKVMGEFIKRAPLRNLQFTGSSTVAEALAGETRGKIRIEDAGFNWKILAADYNPELIDYVAKQCDRDAYTASGQKCSAQSLLFAHQNWVKAGLLDKIAKLAQQRTLADLSIGPVLTESTERMLTHATQLLSITNAKLLFGAKPLTNHSIYHRYGAIEPTAIFIPIEQIAKPEYFELACTEIFGPFQIVTIWQDEDLPLLLDICERMTQHLTAAIVSNDINFIQKILAHSVNGTTYVGIKARTTGALQNHWFGPASDPRASGIGTPEAIQSTWSCHREIIEDFGPINHN